MQSRKTVEELEQFYSGGNADRAKLPYCGNSANSGPEYCGGTMALAGRIVELGAALGLIDVGRTPKIVVSNTYGRNSGADNSPVDNLVDFADE